MTKDKTVTMSRDLASAPRDLLERLAGLVPDYTCAQLDADEEELRKILAAPIVEADGMGEAVAWCDPLQLKTIIQSVIARERMRPMSLPDIEVADAVYAAITEHLPVYEDVYDQLSEIIEPHVKRPYRLDAPLPASVVDSMGFLLKAYTSQTAPVSDDRQQLIKLLNHFASCADIRQVGTAAIDKVKELNG